MVSGFLRSTRELPSIEFTSFHEVYKYGENNNRFGVRVRERKRERERSERKLRQRKKRLRKDHSYQTIEKIP